MPSTLCIETIAVENRVLKNLKYHEARLNKTRHELYGYADDWDLSEMIAVPDSIGNELYKCRLAYSKKIDNIKWESYAPRVIKKIKRVYSDSIDYGYKYDNRDALNTLFAQRGDADEILVIKQGMVTDTLYCNVAFLEGNKWYTPETYLLPGTQRAYLLDAGIIEERAIPESELEKYSHIRLFNAMVGWEKAPTIAVAMIKGSH